MAFIKTARKITHNWKVIIKDAFKEPMYGSACFSILGNNAINFSKLPDGYNRNVTKYFLDASNFIISPDINQSEDNVEQAEIAPAIGPEITPKLLESPISDFTSKLSNLTIRVMNEYYRQLIVSQVEVLANQEVYGSNGSRPEVLAKLIEIRKIREEVIVKNREDEQKLYDADKLDEIKPIWKPLVPSKILGPGDPKILSADKLLIDWVDLVSKNNWIDRDSEAFGRAQALDAQKEWLIESLDLKEASQAIFGFGDISAIERRESSPYVPFCIEKNKDLPKGKPFIIRVSIDSIPTGMEKARQHFDIGKNLRMTIEQGSTIKIRKKRSEDDIKKFLKEADEVFTAQEVKDLKALYEKMSKSSTGDTFVEQAEDQLEALYLSLELFEPVQQASTPGYNDVLKALADQTRQLEGLQADLQKIKSTYKELAKSQANKKLTVQQKNARKLDLQEIRAKIADLKEKRNKNETLRKKINYFKKLIYSQEDTVYLSNTILIDEPLEIRIVDYGVGMVLFDFNKGKDIHIFKDKHFLATNAKAPKNKFTIKNRIRVLGKESYVWLVEGKLKLKGNGGTFIFAYDDVNIGNASIDIPVSTDAKLDVSKDSDRDIVINQAMQIVAVTNLLAYGDYTEIETENEVSEDAGTATKLIAKYKTKGGTITLKMAAGSDSKTLWSLKSSSGTKWVKFLNSDDPNSNPFIEDKVENTLFSYRIVIDFEADEGIPLFFRGFVNIEAKNGDVEDESFVPHVLDPDNYIIKVDTLFNDDKRRPIYQIEVTYRRTPDALIAAGATNLIIPDYLVGKKVDLYYYSKVKDGVDAEWIKIMTDGYITESHEDDMLTITQPFGNIGSPTAARGFFHYRLTKTIFNVTDILRILEDRQMSNDFVLEGYPYERAIKTILTSSGIPTNRLTSLNSPLIKGKNPSTNTSGKFLPIAAPGQKHSFQLDATNTRFQGVQAIISTYGWSTTGNDSIYVDREGQVRLDGPVILASDPRFGNANMVFMSRRQAARSGLTDGRESKYIYFAPIARRRTTEDFFSVIRVSGANDPWTGKATILGVKKKETVNPAYKNEDIYLGHYREKETVEVGWSKTEAELAERLKYEFNKWTYFKDSYDVVVPYNPFLLPSSVIFILPDNAGHPSKFSGNGPSDDNAPVISNLNELISVSWKVLDVQTRENEDLMTVVVVKLSTEEKKQLLKLFGGSGGVIL